MSASFQSSSVVAQMFSSHVSPCSLTPPGLSTSLRASTVTFTMALILAATTTWAKLNARGDLGDRARSGHAALSGYPRNFRNIPLSCESGRRESNPHDQLGRLG